MAHHEHQSCTEACVRCAEEWEHCADACRNEPDAKEMADCTRSDCDRAQVCWAAGHLSRGSPFLNDACRLCPEICDACGAGCAKHEQDDRRPGAGPCRTGAEECRRTAGAAAAWQPQGWRT